jgi:hypothetical protein
LNFPIRLNNKLAHLNVIVGTGEWRPTDGAKAVRVEITRQIDVQLAKFRDIEKNQLPKLLDIDDLSQPISKK